MFESFFTLKSNKWEESNPSTSTSHNKGAAFPLGSKEPSIHAEDRVKSSKSKVFCIACQKGGVGKTTITANLGATLALNHQVLLIDADPQGNLTQSFGANPDKLQYTLYNVLIKGTPIMEAIFRPVEKLPNLYLLGGNLELDAVERELMGKPVSEIRLQEAINEQEQNLNFDFILIDTPPSLGELSLNGLGAADEVLVPVDPGFFSLQSLNKLKRTATTVKKINPNLKTLRVIFNKVETTKISKEIGDLLQEIFGESLLKSTIRKSVRISEAPFKGLPLIFTMPNEEPAKDFRKLAEEICNG